MRLETHLGVFRLYRMGAEIGWNGVNASVEIAWIVEIGIKTVRRCFKASLSVLI